MKIILFSLILIGNSYANDVLIKTDKFSVKTSKQYARQNNPRYCRFKTEIDKENNQLKIRIGVVGSPVDYFGWNMPIDLQDLPLVEGFSKNYKSPGTTGMVMSYSDGTLRFKRMKDQNIFHRLYPFSIKIDPELKKPKLFKAVMEGYERTTLGTLKKHVQAKCFF